MTTPLISVLMAVRDGGAWLDLAIDSILEQDFQSFEFIIVDDGSRDDSAARIVARADPRIQLLRQSPQGLASALNLGGRACRGQLIARMDADDISALDRLARQYAWFSAKPETDVLCSDAILIDASGAAIGQHVMGDWRARHLRDALLYRRRAAPIVHPSVMMRKSIFIRLGGYRDYPSSEDHDFWLRALAIGARFDHVAEPLLHYRINAKGLSSQRARQEGNSAASAVAALVQARCGVDIFDEFPELLRVCASRFHKNYEKNLIPAETAFRNVKTKLRTQDYVGAAFALQWGLAKHGPRLLPWPRRKILKQWLDEAVDEICAALSGTSDRPDDFAMRRP